MFMLRNVSLRIPHMGSLVVHLPTPAPVTPPVKFHKINSLQPCVFSRFYANLTRDYLGEKKLLEAAKLYEHSNLRSNVVDRIGVNLHLTKNHPINIIKLEIEDYFQNIWGKKSGVKFSIFDDLGPIINTHKAFDELFIPPDHPSRRPTDTYYLSPDLVLRPHTSAHQNELLKAGFTSFLCTGDVYRRDSIDCTHFPIFHQMEGLHVFDKKFLDKFGEEKSQVDYVVKDMKAALEGMCNRLFGEVKFRWNDEHFPFTSPSFELEIFFHNEWLEVLGCGVIHRKLLSNCGLLDRKGWAFGLGLERLAMILFEIPDIRLFWSTDSRFLRQFSSGKIGTKFQAYSTHEKCTKDISFWIPPNFHQNAFFDLVRDIAGELVEDVVLVDTYENLKTSQKSLCFRINYRSMDKNLTNKEVDNLQEKVREKVVQELGVVLR